MRFREFLLKNMPFADFLAYEEGGAEVESFTDDGFEGGKFSVERIEVRHYSYECVKDKDGSVYAVDEDGKKFILLEVPDVRHYSISEDVTQVYRHAFQHCTKLEEVDVPFCSDEIGLDYDVNIALIDCECDVKVILWDKPYDYFISEQLRRDIAEGITDDKGFVFSKDGKRLLKAADADEYWIPESVEHLEKFAFIGCSIETLHIPYTCNIDEDVCLPDSAVMIWDRPYSEMDDIVDLLWRREDDEVMDEYGVKYTKNGKRLLCAMDGFDEDEYFVPEGVVTICERAFSFNKKYLKLIIPSSVKNIGGNIFGNSGGVIRVKD